ncbi:ribose-phosphate diphosphokinase [Candidatus Bathyarchaeota archaeon]|nr:MAG: ribose-phosphate diphosphokinase [Candidatus Bathyarchaeota archaeon]
MIVIPGPSSPGLGEKVAEGLGVEVVPVEHRLFPDGESYIRLKGSVRGEEVVIVQTTSPPQDRHLIQLFLLARTAKDYGAEKVVAVVPYLAYARQDKRFLEGEALSIDVVIRLIEASGVDALLTLDIHSPDVLERFTIPVKSLSAIPLIAEHLKAKGFEGAFSLSPDKGAIELAKMGDAVLGGGYDALEKARDRHTGEVRTREKRLPVEGRDVIIFDDMISTGGTMALAVGLAKKCGARRVVAACTHPLLVGRAVERILEAGADEIVGTDSVPGPHSVVSVAPLIVEGLSDLL